MRDCAVWRDSANQKIQKSYRHLNLLLLLLPASLDQHCLWYWLLENINN